MNIADNIPRYLQAELKLLTTACVILETEKLGPKVFGALLVLKQYSIHKCGHERKPITAANCLLSMLGKTNDKHYIIATQDLDLQHKIRNIPGVPLLYLHQKAPVLERPSEATLAAANNNSKGLSETEKLAIDELKKKSGLLKEDVKIHKKKKKKGPNPLSCQKKKKNTSVLQSGVSKKDSPTKAKRKKIRIPKHVKEELLKTLNNK